MNGDPYASHLPTLRSLACLRPRSVLETGCGEYSTRLFLDRAAFPELECLVSIENDLEWIEREKTDDPRHTFIRADPVASGVGGELGSYDLIFIDDSWEVHDRVATIRAVAAQRPRAVVVIHDFQMGEYREAASFDQARFIGSMLGPEPATGICWNEL